MSSKRLWLSERVHTERQTNIDEGTGLIQRKTLTIRERQENSTKQNRNERHNANDMKYGSGNVPERFIVRVTISNQQRRINQYAYACFGLPSFFRPSRHV